MLTFIPTIAACAHPVLANVLIKRQLKCLNEYETKHCCRQFDMCVL
jgi:hypothetical protein